MIHYIAPDGTRIGSKRALKPYLEEFKDLDQENFTFQPITLQIKDPLHKYQSTRPIPTPYRPPRCPQWLHEVNFRDDTPRPPARDDQSTQRGKIKPRRLMDIKIDITGLPRGYRWQIDQERRRRIEDGKTGINPNRRPPMSFAQKPNGGIRSVVEERRQQKNHTQRESDNQQPKHAAPPKRPMMGIYKVIYKDKPPDDTDHHDWP